MTAEELYDGTVHLGWRLARCLHGDDARAADALVEAYADVARRRPRDLRQAQVRLLAVLCQRAGHAVGRQPAA